MKLHQLLSQDRIIFDIDAKKREEVIERMVTTLKDAGAISDDIAVTKMVLNRENQVGTGIGYGVAIPHADPGDFPAPLAVFCRTKRGIDFSAPDGTKANLIILLLTPDNTPALHVRLLARICRLMKSESLRKQLLKATDPSMASEHFAKAEADYPELNP